MPDPSTATHLSAIFERDILKLKAEISAYSDEQQLWVIKAQISNAAGNLCLHLMGNLQHYIGAILGKTGYIRNRPEEFSRKNVPRDAMLEELDRTITVVKEVLAKLSVDTMQTDYPEKVLGHSMTTEYFLLHLLGHLNYHLGQINYHRRLLDNYQPEAGG